ncbi:hypothetical protein SAMN02746065_11611 [Desulfocicer vacuolatum DSM 3385]|uniref:Uncharacterized protein n=1 Tax=Desulfocicer vacuolatum DSM 3385 TaxID=1121400 RepID=A0A1W2D929_9BACT|nr:hypothetical protein [Desulfocicer vacuolatum]SMC93686.1 hypothetical protein SAMN02746065_11611 [Desulfocicer vacuolatum DSM 3385]
MHFLSKHLAIRIWITALAGIPLSFIMISPVSKEIPHLSPPVVYVLIICLVFIITGVGMNFMACQLIKNAIQNARKYEQNGQNKQCENQLIKAVSIYNSAFLLPWKKQNTVEKLTGAMARFSLTHDRATPLFINATTQFLKFCPHETDIAAQWLKKEAFFLPNDPDCDRALTLIARSQKDNISILPLLLHRFVKTRRCDFQARNLYTLCKKVRLLSPSMEQKILTIVPDAFTEFPAMDSLNSIPVPSDAKSNTAFSSPYQPK